MTNDTDGDNVNDGHDKKKKILLGMFDGMVDKWITYYYWRIMEILTK